jgi:hypothetical protein
MLRHCRLDRCLRLPAMGLALSESSSPSSARSCVSTIYLDMPLDEGYRSDYATGKLMGPRPCICFHDRAPSTCLYHPQGREGSQTS